LEPAAAAKETEPVATPEPKLLQPPTATKTLASRIEGTRACFAAQLKFVTPAIAVASDSRSSYQQRSQSSNFEPCCHLCLAIPRFAGYWAAYHRLLRQKKRIAAGEVLSQARPVVVLWGDIRCPPQRRGGGSASCEVSGSRGRQSLVTVFCSNR
jgi:hypothetical protein